MSKLIEFSKMNKLCCEQQKKNCVFLYIPLYIQFYENMMMLYKKRKAQKYIKNNNVYPT